MSTELKWTFIDAIESLSMENTLQTSRYYVYSDYDNKRQIPLYIDD
jgi:hypothetical protein